VNTLWGILRATHVVLALVWIGAQVFVAFLDPRTRAGAQGGGRVMIALRQRRFRPTMLPVGAVTILTGLVLYGQMLAASPSGWAHWRHVIIIGIGGLAGIAALAMGVFISRPVYRQLIASSGAGAGGSQAVAQEAQLEGLRDRLRKTARWIALLLVAAALTMSLAPFA
jgi:hypothetical protein